MAKGAQAIMPDIGLHSQVHTRITGGGHARNSIYLRPTAKQVRSAAKSGATADCTKPHMATVGACAVVYGHALGISHVTRTGAARNCHDMGKSV